jgi:hypothetical protein
MVVSVNQARHNKPVSRIKHFNAWSLETRTDGDDLASTNEDVGHVGLVNIAVVIINASTADEHCVGSCCH